MLEKEHRTHEDRNVAGEHTLGKLHNVAPDFVESNTGALALWAHSLPSLKLKSERNSRDQEDSSSRAVEVRRKRHWSRP